ncbi:hypothetical protein O3G_MSEX008790 [Manduca sexta]|uniref:Fatty acyl-CoA reductase n=1 Tax=Manduca sexta TaxID=7130 RepID=A0A922CQK3_MANSE|nr:hypothetical protein O3G_MSEX008790 [Manduca sexta]KAG6454639.1 hypothetical protein O3G_MSEX008790 [Manduca sexta]KAG6454640.1 hypothetical protein O3G_MSEX008790 [Manduca sexta]KAG6454641.1 hypothetical protein O3G_MSEX008790 [Manduca sexta]
MVINKEAEEQSVADFYDGKSIFITGGTGFLGKVLIARLLLDCPKIKNIYLMARGKRGVSVEKRIIELRDNFVFSKLKIENPEALKKIVPIVGDITTPGLGISADDENELIEKVSIVFHVAATVKFNLPLREALKNNVEGTMQVLSLCKRMKNIQMLVHVSTAYAHCLKDVIEEKLYPPPMDFTDLYLQLKGADDKDISKIIGSWPNTYTFTKSLAEHYLAKNRGNIPVTIVRPSIVAPIEEGPLEGWLDNWYGATGILAAIDKGFLRILMGSNQNLVDLIPVDYVANLSIIVAAKESHQDVAVYNSCSSSSNPLTLRQLIDFFISKPDEKRDYIFLSNKVNFITKYKWIVMLLSFVMSIIPAHISDVLRRLQGKRPRYVNIVSRILTNRESLDFFTSHSWVFKNDETRSLFSSLSPQDQQTFPCDPTTISWPQYMAKYKDGVRRFLDSKINYLD